MVIEQRERKALKPNNKVAVLSTRCLITDLKLSDKSDATIPTPINKLRFIFRNASN